MRLPSHHVLIPSPPLLLQWPGNETTVSPHAHSQSSTPASVAWERDYRLTTCSFPVLHSCFSGLGTRLPSHHMLIPSPPLLLQWPGNETTVSPHAHSQSSTPASVAWERDYRLTTCSFPVLHSCFQYVSSYFSTSPENNSGRMVGQDCVLRGYRLTTCLKNAT